MKDEKKYGMIQIPADVHERLRDFCKQYGFQMGGFTAALIRQALHNKQNVKQS